MILKFFLNDDEIRSFFTECGYTCEMVPAGYWRPGYHNNSEWIDAEKLVVMAGKRQVPAEKLLEETIKARLLSTDLGSKLAIKKALKNLK